MHTLKSLVGILAFKMLSVQDNALINWKAPQEPFGTCRCDPTCFGGKLRKYLIPSGSR
ncbi:UNVERIFIED_CONTAM: hypothetical protein FKN15_046393 [Acipenser sinensis]